MGVVSKSHAPLTISCEWHGTNPATLRFAVGLWSVISGRMGRLVRFIRVLRTSEQNRSVGSPPG